MFGVLKVGTPIRFDQVLCPREIEVEAQAEAELSGCWRMAALRLSAGLLEQGYGA